MPFYYELHKLGQPRSQRTADGILRLKEAMKDKINGVPERVRSSRLLLATWNLREFQGPKYGGTRQREALYYIAEIIDHFDIVAVQEVRDNLSSLEKVMDILGSSWQYLLTDVTEGRQGNLERMAFVYDTRKVRFGGLAGEVVLPPLDKQTPSFQFARTPYLVGFRTAWFKFTICTAHIYYGRSIKNDPQRIKEIEHLAQHLANAVKKSSAWAKNMIVLGDFNIFDTDDETFDVLTKPGFEVHPKLLGIGTNINQSKHFDQIAFIAPDLKDKLVDCNAGVFDYYQHVYRKDEDTIYADDLKQKNGKLAKYSDWRTYQMSNHLPMWIELRVDFSREYLEAIKAGKKAIVPVSLPINP
ncbi:endonuclease/exonuclease/phosphatase family protein [Fibrisoma limi BUZ 3]|uniref:Endonuclease/exonuclease/phosphatase family protein n=1 Tax=Fibrisoma limi BUZ 3 TaxID=1185876 RepID=I2GRN0_9BACT|nr:endonuclease/exonuclease/phosphatase family protein [Fibrisoma limi]CCH56558.1 endonuclease/exonuclease/phosphatase family protein [Fibrisoma limi BUZ 3]